MKKNYIKMNDNNYLSLGNVINVIKKVSNNSNAMQTEIFCSIFGVNNVGATTINNYCIGIRAIGLEYKELFKNKYEKDDLLDNIKSIVNILEDKIYEEDINNSSKLKEVIDELLILVDNDPHIDRDRFVKKDNYNTFKELLYYSIIENKQPIYKQDINIKINKDELEDYLRVKLYWGESYISSLIELSKRNNIYACADIASLYYDGLITSKKEFDKAFYYYKKAADKNHPKACWMIANMILNNRIEFDLDMMEYYLNKSIELGSAAGYNTLGLCYKRGINKSKKIDLKKAKYYFEISSELGYSFAFNNLGLLYEEEGNSEESIKNYMISADMGNSYALNKVGEYYRKKGQLNKAFIYYSKAIETPISERYKYAYYNLAEYYYKNGYKELGIKKDKKIYDEYMKNYSKM